MDTGHYPLPSLLLSLALGAACASPVERSDAAARSALALSSDPSGASFAVSASGSSGATPITGLTPDTIAGLSPGAYSVGMAAAGHRDWDTTLTLAPGATGVVDAILPAQGGDIVASSDPAGARLWLDGDSTGRATPDTLRDVALGPHALEARLTGFEVGRASVAIREDRAVESVAFTLQPRCPGDNVVGSLQEPASLGIVGLAPGGARVGGVVDNIDARTSAVVLWAKTDRWYVQPWIAYPWTAICGDGSWSNDTHPWQRMVALLVDSASYEPGSTREYHPSYDAGVLAWDEYPSRSAGASFEFGGVRWVAKTAREARTGPGPNWFSDDADDLWLDAEGLHLTTAFHDDRWYATEVLLDHSLGYGTYTFQLGSRVDSLDVRAVFSGFVYESQSREIDIEFSRVLANPHEAQYVVQPYTVAGNVTRFDMPSDANTSHRFEWRPDSIRFVSWRGLDPEPTPESTITAWIYAGPDIPPPGGERMHFNLWLFDGGAPSSGQRDEVVVRSFSFDPSR